MLAYGILILIIYNERMMLYEKNKKMGSIFLATVIVISSIFSINCNAESLGAGDGRIVTNNRWYAEDDSSAGGIVLCDSYFFSMTYYLRSDKMMLLISESDSSYIFSGKKIEKCDGYEVRYAKNKLYEDAQSRKFMKKVSLTNMK